MRKVTAVHKANVLRISDALFLREVRQVASGFADIAYDEQLVDSMAAMLLQWLSIRHGEQRARRTADLGGPLGSQAFTDALCAEMT